MAETKKVGSVAYATRDSSYFAKRGLIRHANVWHLWALGVGAVISGHFSGWNGGLLQGGWGGMFIATIVIGVMYLGLTFAIAEMSPALPHTGAAYSFARTAMGPWGGFLTGLAENVEYVLTPAVIVFFIGSYLTGIFGTPDSFQPVWWVLAYIVFVGLNVWGVALSFRVTLVVTLLALACLLVFWISAIPNMDFSRWALNIGPGGVELPEGNGPFLPNGIIGIFYALPFAVWLFLAVEQLPLAAEESMDPKRDMPRGIIAAFLTLVVSAFAILTLNPSVAGIGSFALGSSGEPLLDGFKAIYGDGIAKGLALVAVLGLIASFHTIIFAQGRQIFSLSRAGYFPTLLSVTHDSRKTPHIAMVAGALLGLAVILSVWFLAGEENRGSVIGFTLLNMAVFGAMLSYIMQGISFILLRQNQPNMDRPFRNPFGVPGAALTVIIAAVTIYFQITGDAAYRAGILGVAIWFAVFIAYFALVGRHKLILSPEEEFALEHKA
ncbi:amino acid ABC transporter permease [Devosia limi DSM 17137]|uniref:Amino acid ABC transporter permease n=1 Tax=Devosia limi DSM 17137 TaxID=1121477 RepID=A0A0F5L4D0_9HYPH|nr:amino acid permease [Devosia limi]KKB77070.1 amino acid ABC transporter permease [Devosia limi DSM 17137]SHF41482.1 ethanolamine:proton symporter, EAT family (TC 2.A.3.5.1) [Devosia limi DSM 17137]